MVQTGSLAEERDFHVMINASPHASREAGAAEKALHLSCSGRRSGTALAHPVPGGSQLLPANDG